MSDSETPPDAPKALAAHLLGSTDLSQQDVAEKVDVSARTIRRWLEEPAFRAAVLAETRRFLLSCAGVGASRLRRMLRDARDRDVAPILRLYLEAIGLLRDDPDVGEQQRGPVVLPAESEDWAALASRRADSGGAA